jgi:hypothetical protein
MLLDLQSRMELIVACFSYFILFNVVKVKVIIVIIAYFMLCLTPCFVKVNRISMNKKHNKIKVNLALAKYETNLLVNLVNLLNLSFYTLPSNQR